MIKDKLSRQIDLEVSGLHVREAEDGKRSRTIDGYAVVFGVRSINLTPWSSYREVYEVIEPGSITNELLMRSDIVLTAFHDNKCILGRCKNGHGTLNLSLDSRGLRVECTLAETERANEMLSAIERGDIDGMSFKFRANEDDSENGVSYEMLEKKNAEGKEVWLRHVRTVTGLYDVTIAGHPAYPQTTLSQREIDETDKFLDEHLGEPTSLVAAREADAIKRQQDEQQKKEAMEREAKRRLRNVRRFW